MLLTICTIRQLPQVLTLGDSFSQFTTNGQPILIGLADDPTHLPSGFISPFPILPIKEFMSAEQLTALSAIYTPTEFSAACKPLFIAEALRRYPDTERFIYANPNILFTAPINPILEQLDTASILLTPFITRRPVSDKSKPTLWPDEKFFQNIGLYSSDFLAFRRSPETERMLNWWDNRVRERAYINFCEGLCLDQLWLMHVPVFFRNVHIEKNPGWHVALWNLPERTLRSETKHWFVDGPASQNQPLRFINFKGLFNSDEGFFPHQNQVLISKRSDAAALLRTYQQSVASYQTQELQQVNPAYGQQPEPLVLRGWQHATVKSMRAAIQFLDQVHLPAI